MKRKSYGRDAGLTGRMIFTTFLLGLLYVVFAVVLFQVLNVALVPMILIVVGLAFFQYYTSDKLALAASGAKVVTPEEAPDLHAMVERLCAMADLPKPKVAIIDTDMPLPLPDQSTVGPATPRTYWLGAISSWGIDLVKRGYTVATLASPNAITYGDATKTYDHENPRSQLTTSGARKAPRLIIQ